METYLSAPVAIDLNVTERCNLRCIHCKYGKGLISNKNELTTEELKKLLKELNDFGVFYVSLSGGEPFLRRDLFEILSYGKKLNIFLSLSTNGTLISETNLKKLKKLGIHRLTMSLDGSTPEKHNSFRGSPESFNTVINSIRLCKANKLSVYINTVITSKNIDDINNIINLLEKENVDTIRLITYCPGEPRCNDKLVPKYEDWKDLIVHLTERKKEKSIPVTLVPTCPWEVYEPLMGTRFENEISKIWNLHFEKLISRDIYCRAGIETCAIDSNGDVYPCTVISSKEWCAGNIRETSFDDIWNNSPVFKFFRSLKLDDIKGKCKFCKIRNICGGGCRAAAFNLLGDIYASDSRCGVNNGKNIFT